MQVFIRKIADEHGPYFNACARLRNMSIAALLGRLVDIIGRDQLVLSILDDDSKPDRQKGAHRYKPKGSQNDSII
jgi:hypothetical protein